VQTCALPISPASSGCRAGTASATATSTRRPATPPWRWCPPGTPTASRVTPPAPARCWWRASGARSRAGWRWTSSWWTSATTRPGRATSPCCSAPGTAASRPPRTGRTPRARSATRSSPAAAPGSRGSTGGTGRGVAAERLTGHRSVRRQARMTLAAGGPYGTLRGTPGTAVAEAGTELYYEIDEPDEPDVPDGQPGGGARGVTVVFSHGYCLSQDVW